MFEKLKKIAKEEFGCDIICSEEKSTFEKLFGFSIDSTDTNNKNEVSMIVEEE